VNPFKFAMLDSDYDDQDEGNRALFKVSDSGRTIEKVENNDYIQSWRIDPPVECGDAERVQIIAIRVDNLTSASNPSFSSSNMDQSDCDIGICSSDIGVFNNGWLRHRGGLYVMQVRSNR
jgi:hypothetical protein